MSDYARGYEKGLQMAMVIDIGLWVLLGFLVSKYFIGKMYYKNTGEIMSVGFIIGFSILAGVFRAFMVMM